MQAVMPVDVIYELLAYTLGNSCTHMQRVQLHQALKVHRLQNGMPQLQDDLVLQQRKADLQQSTHQQRLSATYSEQRDTDNGQRQCQVCRG